MTIGIILLNLEGSIEILFTELKLDLWQKFALSALIGLMVGLEREHSHQKKDGILFAVIRTFRLIYPIGVCNCSSAYYQFSIRFCHMSRGTDCIGCVCICLFSLSR